MSTGTVRRPTQDEWISEGVVYAVAEHTGTDPQELTPLHDVVDPDALNQLFESNGSDGERTQGRVTFDYCECTVTVSADGSVLVSWADQQSRPARQSSYT